MNQIKKQISICEALRILELPSNSYNLNSNLPFNLLTKQLEDFKKLVLKQRKKLVFKYHPDLSEDGNETRMKEINNIIDIIKQLKIIPKVPKPINFFNFIINTDTLFSDTLFSDTNTSSSYTYTYTNWH